MQSQTPYGKKSDKKGKNLINLVIPIKKLAKFILGPYLTPRLQVPVDFKSPFRCDIELFMTQSLNLPDNFISNLSKSARKNYNQNQRHGNENTSTDDVLGAELSRIVGDSTNFCELGKYLPEKTLDEVKLTHKLTVFREIVYVAGRYLKLQRGIAQTGDEQADEEDDSGCARLDYSIERAIDSYLRKYVDYSNMILTAAGREDIDVRMLGSGRPFIL